MAILRTTASMCMFLVASFSLAACESFDADKGSLPTKSDCMVYVSAKEGVAIDFSQYDDEFTAARFDLGLPVTVVKYSRHGGVYIVYTRNCDRKEEFSRSMMARALGADEGNLSYTLHGLKSEPKTVMFRGDYWSDGDDGYD